MGGGKNSVTPQTHGGDGGGREGGHCCHTASGNSDTSATPEETLN